jgi:hypothetical protein
MLKFTVLYYKVKTILHTLLSTMYIPQSGSENTIVSFNPDHGTCLHMLCVIVYYIHIYEKINFNPLNQRKAIKHVLITSVNL